MARGRRYKRRMGRRYTKQERDQRPRPSALWGEWKAVLQEDVRPTDIKAFIDECIFASIEGVSLSFKEEGFDGTCFDFIVENRNKMAKVLSRVKKAPGEELTKEEIDKINTKEGEILRSLLSGKEMEAGNIGWINYNAPLCIDNGTPTPCLGKIIDASYEYLPRADQNFRGMIINLISKPETDLAAPLCKMGDGSPVACIQKVLDDPESLVGLEKKLLSGQWLQPAFEAECRTLEENLPTSCIDKVIDNLIKYGGDPNKKKYNYPDYMKYNHLLDIMMQRGSQFTTLLGMNIFTEPDGERVSGYDKIIRRAGDRGVFRTFMIETLDLMIKNNVFDYPRMASDQTLCHHPFLEKSTACIDTVFSLMHDRKPGGVFARSAKTAASTAQKFAAFEKIMVKMAEEVKFEKETCIPLPTATEIIRNPETGEEVEVDVWKDERINCLSNVLNMPSAKLTTAVFQVAPNRMEEITRETCRYMKPDGSPIDISCFEAVLRDVTQKGETIRGYDYEPIVKSIIPPGTDLSKPCYNISFRDTTSCLDLLMDLDRKNVAVTEYFINTSDDPEISKKLSAKESCTIQRSDDKWNVGRGKGDTLLDGGPVRGADHMAFMTNLMSPDRPPEFKVSCLDKLLVKMTAQTELPGGYGDALPKMRGASWYSREPDYPPKYPNYLRAGLEALTGTPDAMTSMCRFVYADTDRIPKEIEIPCYQKYLEAILPLARTTPSENEGTYDEFVHEVLTTLDLSKNCTLITPLADTEKVRELPCLLAMVAKYGENQVFNLSSDGRTKMKDRDNKSDDVRCSVIGSKHFGKLVKSMEDENIQRKVRAVASNLTPAKLKSILCTSIKCKSRVDPYTNSDLRVKGKVAKMKFCDCNVSVDEKFSPEDATCFEEACYNTVAKIGEGDAEDEMRKYYHAGLIIPPIVKYAQESMPPDKQIVDDISGVYEVKPRMSPRDLHVRRYVIEFSEVIYKLYQRMRGRSRKEVVNTLDVEKLKRLTGRPILEEAIVAARSLSKEQKEQLGLEKKEVSLTPSVSIHFKKGNEKIEIPSDVLEKAATVRQYIVKKEAGLTEAYSMRPEWVNDLNPNYSEAIKAVTMIAEAYVNSDDKNLYFEVNYSDEDGNPAYDYQIRSSVPFSEEESRRMGISLTKSQRKALTDPEGAGQVTVTLPDGSERIVEAHYSLIPRQLKSSKKFSRLADEMGNLPAEAKKELRHAAQLAAGMPPGPMYVVITTDPRDVMRASTCQYWGSCLKLEDGGGGHSDSLPTYIKAGSYIAFITDDLNNPIWKGRTIIHRSSDPKQVAVQDRWYKHCGVEWIYGMPEFRRLLLDTIRTVLHEKGYNRELARGQYRNHPPYLWASYTENPFPYLRENPDYKAECAVYLAEKAARGSWLEAEFVSDTSRYDDAWWDAFAQSHGFPWAERYDNLTAPIRDAIRAGVISEEEVNLYDGRIKTSLKTEVVGAFRDEFVRIWASTHPQECNTPEWQSHIKNIVEGQKIGKSTAVPVLPCRSSAWLDVTPDNGMGGCGNRQEFRAISDSEIAEIMKYRGDDWIRRVGNYQRSYPMRAVTAP